MKNKSMNRFKEKKGKLAQVPLRRKPQKTRRKAL